MSDLNSEMLNKKKGLGRGLGSLLGGAVEAEPAENKAPPPSVSAGSTSPAADPEGKVWRVGVDRLCSGQYQPRRHFEKESLRELAQSIRENGILQPIVARRTASGKLEIVAGERRWRAAQIAGLHDVPVILKNFNDKEALELAIVENIQREDLNPIEESEGYARLITEFKLSQQQVAERVGKDRATVANAVRLLLLPQDVKEMISSSQLSVGHAKVLLALPDPKKQSEFAKKVVNEKLPVRRLEKMVHAIVKGEPEKANANDLDTNVTQRLISGLGDELQKMLGTKVNIEYSSSRGKIVIHFYSDDELTALVDKLREGCR